MIHIFEAKFSGLPFSITVFANDLTHASALSLEWYRSTAQKPAQSLEIYEADVLSDNRLELDDLRLLKRSGIAIWSSAGNWAVVPPDLTGEGLLRKEPRRVSCYLVRRLFSDEPLVVCAPGVREALELFVGYRDARDMTSDGLLNAAELHGDDVVLHWPELIGLMSLGAVGVPGIVAGHVQILLPWDEAAGEI